MAPDLAILGRWETFYVIVGSAGGALTGLLFVVVALVADRPQPATAQGLSAFTSPSMFHFVNVLLIAAVIAMPRHGLASLAILLGLIALAGGIVTGAATWRIARFEAYRPVLEDWTWHSVIPGGAYVALLIAALALRSATEGALYAVAILALALLVTGIHNAWDVALYSATSMPRTPNAAE